MSKQVQSTTSPSLTPGYIHDWYPFQTFSEDLAVDLEAVLVQGHQERARGPYQVTYVLCQTVGAAQRMASLLNHYKVLAPTTW